MNKIPFCLLLVLNLPEAFPQTVTIADTLVLLNTDIYNNFKTHKQAYPCSGTFASDSAGNPDNRIAADSQKRSANLEHITPYLNPFVDISTIKARIHQLKDGAGLIRIENPKTNNRLYFSADTLKAKLVKSTDKFDIYKLPLDNMKCQVPNKSFQSSMPTMKEFYSERIGVNFSNNMPNRFKKQELIPTEKKPADQ